jgi:ferredoxin-NADP reductase
MTAEVVSGSDQIGPRAEGRRPAGVASVRGALPARWPDLPARWPDLPAATPNASARPARDLTPNATLSDRMDLTADLARFRIRPDGGVPAFAPGQYVSIGFASEAGPILRPYSIASSPDERDKLELLIRRLEGGALTTRLWAARPQTRLWMGPPRGLFTLTPTAPETSRGRDHLFVAAGTGLAPVMAMLEALSGAPGRPRALLLHGVAQASELAYRERLHAWTQDGWLAYHPTVSRPGDPASAGWTGATGRVETHLRSAIGEHGFDPSRTVAFVCGNDGMVAASRDALLEAGVQEHAIHAESFTPGRARAA